MDEIEQGHDGDTAARSNVIAEMSRPGRAENIEELIRFVTDIEKERDFPPERIDEITLALGEAFRNILDNSYRGTGGDISVTCKTDHWGKLMIVIVDSGSPSNILLADVVFDGEGAPVDQRRKGSAKLIKKMVDNVEYKRVEGTNVLTFTVAPRPRTIAS